MVSKKNDFVVKTSKLYKPLTLKHSLVLIIMFNLFLNVFFIFAYLFPVARGKHLIQWLVPVWFVAASIFAIYTYSNCRAYNFLDDIKSKKSSYNKNSGIQLIVYAYVMELSSLFLTAFAVKIYLKSINVF